MPSTTRSSWLALQTPDEIMSNSSRLARVGVAVMLSETPFDFLSLRLDLELSELAENKTLAAWCPGETQRGGLCNTRDRMGPSEQTLWGVTTAQPLLLQS